MLDVNQPRVFSGQMSDHLGTCPACVAHVRDMEMVDAALRNAPDIEVPIDLESKLLAIPDMYTELKACLRTSLEHSHADILCQKELLEFPQIHPNLFTQSTE